MTAGTGQLEVVTSADLGSLSAAEARPIPIQWRWYDNAPLLPLWIALALLLVVPRQNRRWQAWLILVLPLLAAALQLLFFVPSLGASAGFDLLVQLIVTFAIAWASVWLLAPYLWGGSRTWNYLSALAVMFTVGLVSYLGYFGFWWSSQPTIAIIAWSVGCVSLLAALMLSGACCGKDFHAAVTAVWMILWLPLSTAFCMVGCYTAAMALMIGPGMGIMMLFGIMIQVAIASLFFSGALYALNLPVMVLAATTDCYGQRMRSMVCRNQGQESPSDPDNPFAEVPPAVETRFER